MKPTMRNYRDENDYGRIRQFLRETMLANGLRAFSWSVQRLDYWRFFGMKGSSWGTRQKQSATV